MPAFTDTDELYAAVKMFTGQDAVAKQETIAWYGEIGDWDVQNVTDMRYLFYKCTDFNSDLSKWNVENVLNATCMFQDCYAFNSDLSQWNVENIEDMRGMFHNCHNFNSDLSLWNVENVQYMTAMFYNCYAFNSDISKWNVENVTNMRSMFHHCYAFNSDLSQWNVTYVTNMNGMSDMFENCPKFLNSINGFRWNKQYWKILQHSFKTRSIALYWLEQSAITSCAPGGNGRNLDLEAFNQEWVH